MLNPEHFTVTLARTLQLFRTQPENRDDQKAAFRALIGLCQLNPIGIGLEGGVLTVQGNPVHDRLPSVPALIEQLRAHRVGKVEIAQAVPPADLFNFLKAIAADPLDPPEPLGGGGVTVSVLAPPPSPTPSPAAPVPEESTVVDPGVFFADFTGSGPAAGADALEQHCKAVEASPFDGDVLARVSALSTQIEAALGKDRIEGALEAIALINRFEKEAPDDASKRAYAISLRRLLTLKHLSALAPTLTDGRHQESAVQVFVRAGDLATEALLPRLGKAGDARECEAYLKPLRLSQRTQSALSSLLSSSKWFVAAGAAAVLGGSQDREVVEHLAEALDHADVRVRQAALKALVQIGTGPAIEPVRRALASDDVTMQSAAAAAIQGRRSGALTMPLAMAAEADGVDPDVRLELYMALGRIGTPDALQVLIRAALPGGKILARKSTEQRLAAIEGLRLAGPTVTEHLEKFAGDKDKIVAAAAARALAEVRAVG